MRKISAKAEYACLAMVELARRERDGAPTRIRDIADEQGIPERYLVQILLQLKGAGLVLSTRGASGGYRLARDADALSVGEVLAAIDGPDEGARDGGPDTPAARALNRVWDAVRRAEREVLDRTTFGELARAPEAADWVI